MKLRQMPSSLSVFRHFAAPVAVRLSCSCSLLAYLSSLLICVCVFAPADSASVSAAAVLASGCAPVLFAARPQRSANFPKIMYLDARLIFFIVVASCASILTTTALQFGLAPTFLNEILNGIFE